MLAVQRRPRQSRRRFKSGGDGLEPGSSSRRSGGTPRLIGGDSHGRPDAPGKQAAEEDDVLGGSSSDRSPIISHADAVLNLTIPMISRCWNNRRFVDDSGQKRSSGSADGGTVESAKPATDNNRQVKPDRVKLLAPGSLAQS
nr:uncharacterized protein LOC120966331 [Aegilops tauschii subsp. strangulata]